MTACLANHGRGQSRPDLAPDAGLDAVEDAQLEREPPEQQAWRTLGEFGPDFAIGIIVVCSGEPADELAGLGERVHVSVAKSHRKATCHAWSTQSGPVDHISGGVCLYIRIHFKCSANRSCRKCCAEMAHSIH